MKQTNVEGNDQWKDRNPNEFSGKKTNNVWYDKYDPDPDVDSDNDGEENFKAYQEAARIEEIKHKKSLQSDEPSYFRPLEKEVIEDDFAEGSPDKEKKSLLDEWFPPEKGQQTKENSWYEPFVQ